MLLVNSYCGGAGGVDNRKRCVSSSVTSDLRDTLTYY